VLLTATNIRRRRNQTNRCKVRCEGKQWYSSKLTETRSNNSRRLPYYWEHYTAVRTALGNENLKSLIL